MTIQFLNAADLAKGIAYVAPDLGFEVVGQNADLTVTVTEVAERTVTVTLDGDRAAITYGDGKARFSAGLQSSSAGPTTASSQKPRPNAPCLPKTAVCSVFREAVSCA